MRFSVDARDLDVKVVKTIVAGWTARDRATLDHHIKELAELGVSPPSVTPLFYRISSQLLTLESKIEVVGPDTSGEVEPMIVATKTEIFLGLISDHTDRALEAFSVAASKQACPKPLASQLWRFQEVESHLDQLEIKAWIWEGGSWVLYQQGLLALIRPLKELIEMAAIDASELAEGEAIVMMCGTCPVTSGGIRPAAQFRMSISDPVNGAEISHQYRFTELPMIA